MRPTTILLFLAAAALAAPEGGAPLAERLLLDAGSDDGFTRAAAVCEIDSFPVAERIPILLKGLRHHRAPTRLAAAWALGEAGERKALGSLARTAITDPDDGVRRCAVRGMVRIGHEDLAFPFLRALNSEEAAVRIRAEEALGEIGDPRSVEYLIKVYEFAGGGSPRASIFVGTQTSYIQDYDVAVAQAAAIADPRIGLLQAGAVLDAKVLGVFGTMTVVERRTIVRALERITGRAYGDNLAAWRSWLAWHRSGAPKPGEPPAVKDGGTPPTTGTGGGPRDPGGSRGRRYYLPRGRPSAGTGDCGGTPRTLPPVIRTPSPPRTGPVTSPPGRR